MAQKPEKWVNRRDFLQGTVRATALAGLGAVGALLGIRAQNAGPAADRKSQICVSEFICSRCTVLPDCKLPQALSAREAAGK